MSPGWAKSPPLSIWPFNANDDRVWFGESFQSKPNESFMTVRLTDRPEWNVLKTHFAEVGTRHLRDLFDEDPGRGEALSRVPFRSGS